MDDKPGAHYSCMNYLIFVDFIDFLKMGINIIFQTVTM